MSCEVCRKPENQHVWLTKSEAWERRHSVVLCNVRSKWREDARYYKVCDPVKALDNPCDKEFMKDISS